jgi:hypothetical protein
LEGRAEKVRDVGDDVDESCHAQVGLGLVDDLPCV